MTTAAATGALVRGLAAGDRDAMDALVAASGTSHDATLLAAHPAAGTERRRHP